VAILAEPDPRRAFGADRPLAAAQPLPDADHSDWALATIVAIPAIVVGIIEIIIIIRDRKSYNPIWAPLGAAALYVLLGLLLLFMPLAGTLLAVQVGGALLAIFAILQLYQTWMAIRETPGVRPASQ